MPGTRRPGHTPPHPSRGGLGAAAWRGVVLMAVWDAEQDDVLRECCYRGAEFCRDEIERRCGVSHSVRAVEMRASRIRCSLAVRTVCPNCGAVGVNINKSTGMCRRCSETFHLEEERAFREVLEAERAEAEDAADIDDIRRERDRLRKANSRFCKLHGLKSRRDRGWT